MKPYDYTWSNGENVEDIYNLFAGTYSVTVVDNNGCVATLSSIDVIEPNRFCY